MILELNSYAMGYRRIASRMVRRILGGIGGDQDKTGIGVGVSFR
jgi:hypothetical protein